MSQGSYESDYCRPDHPGIFGTRSSRHLFIIESVIDIENITKIANAVQVIVNARKNENGQCM